MASSAHNRERSITDRMPPRPIFKLGEEGKEKETKLSWRTAIRSGRRKGGVRLEER